MSLRDFLDNTGLYVGRIWRPGIGPAIVTLRGSEVVDVTCRDVPTLRDLLEHDAPATWLRAAQGEPVCTLADLEAMLACPTGDGSQAHLRFRRIGA